MNTEYRLQEAAIYYDESVILFVNDLLQQAIKKQASDIHIEPFKYHCRIRYRCDGILYEMSEITNTLAVRVITRLKVLAKLDIAERRLPQDGGFSFEGDTHGIDIRLNACPTLFGEKLVLRLLNVTQQVLDIHSIGLIPTQEAILKNHIEAPQGLVFITGPTGSGKTVTLYAILHYLNHVSKNISTIEDPIEIQLKGINQINIHPKIGLSFSTILRALLRQDPDVIMVGEIRDTETATLALQAAQTGHLVLSTLHTHNTIDTLARLQSLGVATETILQPTTLIIAQRLIRKLCPECKAPDLPSLQTRNKWHISDNTVIYRAEGCNQCLQGFRGRIGIYEFLSIDPITKQTTTPITLYEAALQLVFSGHTSLHEVQRVIQS